MKKNKISLLPVLALFMSIFGICLSLYFHYFSNPYRNIKDKKSSTFINKHLEFNPAIVDTLATISASNPYKTDSLEIKYIDDHVVIDYMNEVYILSDKEYKSVWIEKEKRHQRYGTVICEDLDYAYILTLRNAYRAKTVRAWDAWQKNPDFQAKYINALGGVFHPDSLVFWEEILL